MHSLRRSSVRSAARGSLRRPRHQTQRFVGTTPEPPQQPSAPPPTGPKGGLPQWVSIAAVFAVGAGAAYYIAPGGKSEPEVPKAPKKAKMLESLEPNDPNLQSEQVKRSWQNPGVYVWGSNAGRVVDPDSKDGVVKAPRRIKFFDGQLLRDLKLTRDFGVAVSEKGDLIQWGLGFSPEDPRPRATLSGKDIVQVGVSSDRVIARSKRGDVYSIPVSLRDQHGGSKQTEQSGSSWVPFWSGSGREASMNYQTLTPKGESVTDVKCGMDHCLMLTSTGRVFSAAASTSNFPSRGQLGIAGLRWDTRPKGPFFQAHEVPLMPSDRIQQIAAGDYHSMMLDDRGRAYAFGDNAHGQLGLESQIVQFFESPIPVKNVKDPATRIAAGGNSTFFITKDTATPKNTPLLSSIYGCGNGVFGGLGNGKWSHVAGVPLKLASLSGLSEWDEKANKMVPLVVSSMSIGATHASATLGYPDAGAARADETFGLDVLFWGGNEHFQLGTGKRTNVNKPTYIEPLDCRGGDRQRGRNGDVRMQIAPRAATYVGEGGGRRWRTVEQRVECGRNVTGVYSAVA